MSELSKRMRAEWSVNDAKRDAGLTTPETVERFDGLAYGPDPVWNRLDVYRPKCERGNRLPVIVSIHGGGWVYGDKELYQFYCMSLAVICGGEFLVPAGAGVQISCPAGGHEPGDGMGPCEP